MPDFVMDPRVLTPDQMREHVLAYTQTPHGLKKRYLARHGLTQYWMRKWSRAMKAGDLDAANSMREAVLNSESLSAAVVGRDDTGDHEARAAAV